MTRRELLLIQRNNLEKQEHVIVDKQVTITTERNKLYTQLAAVRKELGEVELEELEALGV